MKVVMLAYHNTKEGQELKPGEAFDGWDDAETQRQIKIGGARMPTQAELDAWAKADEKAAADLAAEKAAADKAAADEAAAKAAAEVAAKAATIGKK
jgi:colicin import membrane protein